MSATLPRSPLYAFLTLPRGLMLKVHAEPCMYAPGYLQSNRQRWPAAASGVAPSRQTYECAECSRPDCNWRGECDGESCPACGGHVVPVDGVQEVPRG